MKKTNAETAVPQVKGLDCFYLPTGKFEDAWKFWTDVAGGEGAGTWGAGAEKSGKVTFAGQTIVLGGGKERDEDEALGLPVKHGMATLYFSTPDIEKLRDDLAGRGAQVLRGPLTTHWGAMVMTVKAGDAVVAFIEKKDAVKGDK